MSATKELTAIPGVDEEFDGRTERSERTGKTARAASQPCQIMAEFGIVTFDRIGLTLVGQRLMMAGIVDEVRIGGELIGVVLGCLGCPVKQGLQAFRLAVIGHLVGNDAAGGPVYLCDEVDARFFEPSKV